jgi:hypothetical protein
MRSPNFIGGRRLKLKLARSVWEARFCASIYSWTQF